MNVLSVFFGDVPAPESVIFDDYLRFIQVTPPFGEKKRCPSSEMPSSSSPTS